ncbi:hypothetical protein FACS1894181_01480 [Bacteroidia bacterium]|nr:hypothetical protein FACS1894181_01480 [Bacteroidia bacterium]
MLNIERELVFTAVLKTEIEEERKAVIPLERVENALLKRIFDILFSLAFLVTVFPVIYVVVGIVIRLSSPGPVFFVQEREGKRGRSFRCYKFRSMRVNMDTKQACPDDPRITRFGKFIRRTNIDELPQFINVFKGDMSVVGPRPHPVWLNDKFSVVINNYGKRHTVKPGITGLAQVSGFRGETKNVEDMEGRVARDIWYMKHWTFWMDVRIVVMTVVNMFRGEKNAY